MTERQPGSIFDGKYEILQRLGSGGMGDIYLVRHLHLDQKRVIKILRQELASSEAAQKRFQREARLATAIKHPNVAILYDYASLEDASFYMVWEHIEGNDVGFWLERYGPFPLHAALQLAIQTLRGLGEIHAAGVIHRDISPDNLMITRGNQNQYLVKIIDLGLAKALEPDPNFDLTQAGTFMGKLRYCSPEQAGLATSGEPLDLRTDIYSFGMVLYEMICGLPPFAGGDSPGFIFKRLSEEPLPLSGRNPAIQVPADLDQVVLRALARDREQRFASAAELIRALAPIEESLRRSATRTPSGGTPVVAMRATTPPSPAPAAVEEPAPPAPAAPPLPLPPPPGPVEDVSELALSTLPSGPAAVLRATPPAAAPPASERPISNAERLDLLAEIDQAAQRVKETSKMIDLAQTALQSGQLEEARRVVGQLESANPGAPGLETLKNRLEQAQEQENRRQRIQEAEKMLERYLQQGKKPLADLALGALLELSPNHPRRDDFESWVKILGEEVSQQERAEKAVEAGREALARGDLKAARKQLEIAARNDPGGRLTEAFLAELDAVQQERSQTAELAQYRDRFEAALAAGKLEGAEAALGEIAALDVPRLTVTMYRRRLDEALALREEQSVAGPYEQRFESCCAALDWEGAREAAHELNEAFPGSRRAAEMFAEVDRRDQEARRHKAVEQGVRQVEEFIDAGDAERARMALRILVQMEPGNPRWQQLEHKIRELVTRH